MVFSMFSVLASNTSYASVTPANASSQPITGLSGYKGNDVFYLTTAITDSPSCFYYLPNTTGSLQDETVLQVMSVNESDQHTINGNLQVSGDQPVLTDHGWVQTSYLHIGEMILDPLNGSYVAITSLHHSQGTSSMYDFMLSGNNDFIAYTYLLQGVMN